LLKKKKNHLTIKGKKKTNNEIHKNPNGL